MTATNASRRYDQVDIAMSTISDKGPSYKLTEAPYGAHYYYAIKLRISI
jgi:hypothetical protein